MAEIFNHLLLATERTEFDAGAERLAFALAARCGKPLLATIPVVSNPEYEAVAPALAQRRDEEIGQQVDALHAVADRAGVSLETTVRHGQEPFAEIVDEARARGADLIVIRRRGKRGFFAKLLVGEMVSKVIGHAPCSVLIVPRAAQMWSKTLLIATDGSPNGERACRVAGAIARQCGMAVAVVSAAAESASEERRRLAQEHADQSAETLRAGGLAVSAQARAGKPHDVILAAAREAGADLIVVGRSGRSGVERVLLGSTAERVAGFAECPVLIAQ
jgi:nucleotide-binding universal stress UspA family protein